MENSKVPAGAVIDLTSRFRQLKRRRDIELNITAFLDDQERESLEALKCFFAGIVGLDDETISI